MDIIPQAIIDLRKLEIQNKKRIWKPFLEKYNCQSICELGVFQGENFSLLVDHNPQTAVAVDAWINDGTLSRDDLGFTQTELNDQYLAFALKMSGKPFVKIYREYTFEAVKHFSDEYFDLIYIDADHTYEGCLKDITDWYPKVKRGRFLIGDDFRETITHQTNVKFGVIEAVREFTSTNDLNFYELPRYGWAIIKP